MSEYRFLLGVWAIVGITIVSVAAITTYSSYKHSQLFVEGKYVECMLPGSNSAKWCR